MLKKYSEKEKLIIPIEVVTQRIFFIRGVKVILDVDLAEFYGVATKRLNEQVKRNKDRFPEDFMFQLNKVESENANRSQFATGSQTHRDPKFLPYAFTEHGVTMLASVLKSKRATEMSIFIVRTFIKIREILASNKDLAHQIEELQREQKLQNKHINSIYSLIDRLIEQPKKHQNKIGFGR